MKISYDKEADVLTIILKNGHIVKDIMLSENTFAGYSNKSERTILQWIESGNKKSS